MDVNLVVLMQVIQEPTFYLEPNSNSISPPHPPLHPANSSMCWCTKEHTKFLHVLHFESQAWHVGSGKLWST